MFPTIKIRIEKWKYNSTFELYVSTMGHFRNKSKAPLAPKVNNRGYLMIWCAALGKYLLAHRVVMLTWDPRPNAESLTVDHLDHNKRNNAVSNLEWVEREENWRRAQNDLISVVIKENKKVNCIRVDGKGRTFYIYENRDGLREVCDFIKGLNPSNNTETIVKIVNDLFSGKNPTGLKKYGGMRFEKTMRRI